MHGCASSGADATLAVEGIGRFGQRPLTEAGMHGTLGVNTWYIRPCSQGVLMIRKIYRTGNSIVVALPKEMLEALNLQEGGSVSVELDRDHQQISISPVVPADGVNEVFAKQVAEFIDEYRSALEALAK